MAKSVQANAPLYEQVKLYVLNLIEDEAWGEGRRLPSESKLVKHCNASRMTVNRALRELAGEGHIERVAGVGTFAAEARANSHPLDIRNIAEEIAARGHIHSCRVIDVIEIRAKPEVAIQFSVMMGSRIFRSQILHLESGMPIQFEDRFVLPDFAPEYDRVDFNTMTTNEYLLKIGPHIEKWEQKLTSKKPPPEIADALQVDNAEHCLVLTRRTWVAGRVVTYSHLYHPASRFQFESTYSV